MEINKLCLGCMQEKPMELQVCPYCGFDLIKYQNKINDDEMSIIETNRRTMYSNTTPPKELPQRPLPPGTIIGGGYAVGKKLGAGGFGVSYIGFDINFERKVAIKEFYPRGYADRDVTGQNLVPRAGKRGEYFCEQRELFAHEGKVLAQIDEPGVVKVLSFCKEFNTAYIVMEFLEGEALNDYLKRRGGYLPCEEAFTLLKPIVKSLASIHEKGLIHRDISPDNVMLTANGPKLIDFGAALGKGEHPEGPPIGKRGYAPSEQLTRGGVVGAYSDVYSLCAMIYQIITGQKPPRSLDREKQDTIYTISAFQVPINPIQEAAVMQGLAMDYRVRIKNSGDLYYLLYVYGVDPNASVEGLQKKVKESSTEVIIKKMQDEHRKSQNKTKMMIATACVLVAGFLIIAVSAIGTMINNKKDDTTTGEAITMEKTSESEKETYGTDAESFERKKNDMYALINADRQEKGKSDAGVDTGFENACIEAVNECTTIKASSTDEWGEKMSTVATSSLERNSISGAGWVLRGYEHGTSISVIKDDLYAAIDNANEGVANAIDPMNCQKIGIAVSLGTDGTEFWMVIYR